MHRAQAFDPPKPNPYLAKQLAKTGISEQEWLLFDGIRKNNIEQVGYALTKGADPNYARDVIGDHSPLIVAVTVYASSEAIVDVLIKHGADVNGRFTPKPVSPPEPTISSRMLTAIANQTSIGERTPLHFAAGFSTPRVISLLIARGAQVDAKDSQSQTPLFNVPIDKRENAEMLLKAGANINARDRGGKTVLWHKKWWMKNVGEEREAIRQAREAYVNWLISMGAEE